VTPRPWRR